MIFILDGEGLNVLKFYPTKGEFHKDYPYFSSGGSYRITDYYVLNQQIRIVNYSFFQTEEYKEQFTIPPKIIKVCSAWLRQQKINTILK